MAKTRKSLKNKAKGAKSRSSIDWRGIPDRVRAVAEPLCHGEGLELVHVECLPEPQGRVLRIYLDKPGGILLDDCVAISRTLSDLLDVELDIRDRYRLEVSSPGTDRPLGKPEDFDRFAGEQIKIQLREPLDRRKTFTGRLQGRRADKVRIVVDGQEIEIPCDGILRARLAPQ